MKKIKLFFLKLFIIFFCISFTNIKAEFSPDTLNGFEPENLEKPERDSWQKPDKIIKYLEIKPDNIIADIGAGSGYFTHLFAKSVPSNGVVYAVDIESKMLRYIHRRVEKEKLDNIVTVLSPPNDPMLPPGSMDLIFICNTIHLIENRMDYLNRIKRYLKPDGRLAIIDFHKKDFTLSNTPLLEERINKKDMIAELEKAGFTYLKDIDFLPYQWFVIFKNEKKSCTCKCVCNDNNKISLVKNK